MKKIILKENQFNRILLNEYLDKNYGIPLYRYLNMSYNQKIDSLFKWGIDNDLIEEYYKNEDGMNYLLEYASDYVTEKYGEFDDEEEFEDRQNEVLEELYSDFQTLLNSDEILVDKKTKKGIKKIDIKEYFKDTKHYDTDYDIVVRVILPAGNTTNINPTLLINALNEKYGIDVYYDITRVDVFDSEGKSFE